MLTQPTQEDGGSEGRAITGPPKQKSRTNWGVVITVRRGGDTSFAKEGVGVVK